MKNSKIKLLAAVSLLSAVATKALAADNGTGGKTKDLLKTVGDQSGYVTTGGTGDVFSLISIIVSTALSILGVVFVVLMIYAGYNWLTAAGDEAKVTKAKDTIWRAIIGLIIVVGAYAIWSFVQKILY